MDQRDEDKFGTGRILRDHLAFDRTRLANERTLLAYVRTGLTFIVTGLAFLKFLSSAVARVIGWFFLPVGGLCFLVGIISFVYMHRRYHRKMEDDSNLPTK